MRRREPFAVYWDRQKRQVWLDKLLITAIHAIRRSCFGITRLISPRDANVMINTKICGSNLVN